MRRITLLVTLDWPEGVTITEMKNFVREALDTWGGQLEPPAVYDKDDLGIPYLVVTSTRQ